MYRPSLTAIGIGAGLLFFAHALIPNSHAWPLIWPMLGGIIAVVSHAKDSDSRFTGSVAAAAKAGGIAGGLFFLATALALVVLQAPAMQSPAAALGADGPIMLNAPVLLALATAALIGVIVALVAGAAAHAVAKR